LFTKLIVFGTLTALIPNLPVIKLLLAIASQVLNGVMLPIILLFVLRLVNDKQLTGDLKNTHFSNVLGWGTFAMVSVAVAIWMLF
jgi:Mn2+/Fe2+ NRAMP family transporter